MSDEHERIEFIYDVHYCNHIIKSFDDRREAIRYVDEFFGGVDDDRREDNIFIYCGEYVMIYQHCRLTSYKE